MSLLVVITSYRAPDLTIDCLHSLAQEKKTVHDMKVGICDNGNTDDTYDKITQVVAENNWSDWAYVRRVMPNRGFSGGNNVILREALNSDDCPDFFLLLNADTVVRPGALAKLLKSAKQYPEAGILGPRLEYLDGTPQISCFRYISPVSEMIHAARTGPVTRLLKKWDVPLNVSDEPIQPEWLSFACALIRKEVMQQNGVVDEGYFLYFDDVDYCRTTAMAGWKVQYIPDAVVVHLRGKSNPVKEYTLRRQRRPEYWYKSRSWYFTKHYGKKGLLLANTLWLAGQFISRLREVFGSKQPHLCEKEGRDIWIDFTVHVEPRTSIVDPYFEKTI